MSHRNDLKSLLSQNEHLTSHMTNTSEEYKKIMVDAKSKCIIKTVMERCKKEANCKRLLVPIEDYEKRVSFYTGFPKTYIGKLNNDKTLNRKSVDPTFRFKIARIMKDLYSKRESHTYKYVYDKLQVFEDTNDSEVPPFSQFCHDMTLLGYDYRKTLDGYLLMENPKLTFERFFYLKKIKHFRDKGHYIYYIDERVVNFEKDFKKPWQTKYDANSMILFHMISKYKYENGLFCCYATADDFLKWLIDIILPILKPSSVVVIDNGPFHGKLDNAPISRYHTKEDMLKWLRNNNIPCDVKMHKAELYELIDKCSSRTQQYHLDSILKANGHEVLRLPTNYHDLSPTDLLWKDITQMSKNWTKPYDSPTLRHRMNQAIAAVPANQWLLFDEMTRLKEIGIAIIDEETASFLEKHKLDVDDIVTKHASGFEECDGFDNSD